MKGKHFSSLIALTTLAIAFSVQAHDPKEHMKDAEKPDCAAMKNMDHSKMDMSDPMMQAMMKQCMNEMNHDMSTSNVAPDETQSEQQKSEHQH